MTSPSLRKLRTIRPNIIGRRATNRPATALLAALLLASPAAAAEPSWWRQTDPVFAATPPATASVDVLHRPVESDEWTALPRATLRPDGDRLRLISHAPAFAENPSLDGPVMPLRSITATADFVVGNAPRLFAHQADDADSQAQNEVPDQLPTPLKPQPRDDDKERDIPDDPRELKGINAILPFGDYEPDPELAKTDPRGNLCPRPGATGEECPDEVNWPSENYPGRLFEQSLFAWDATNLSYNPLYFEDVQLERYGHTYPECIQPFVSVGRMTQQVLWWPYHATLEPPQKCVYPLGYYQPGECAPKLFYQPPLNAHAGLVQAGVTTGLFYIFP